MNDWHTLGKHRARVEGDIFVCINVGPVSLHEMQQMSAHLNHAVDTKHVRFFLLDLAHADIPSPEARKWMAQHPYRGIQAVAGYGASRVLVVMSDLMRRALNALRPNRTRTPFRLFATEAEARTFFQTIRDSEPRQPSVA